MRDFWWFLAFRALVGVGEASYSTIAPAIISDLYSRDQRSVSYPESISRNKGGHSCFCDLCSL